MLFKNYFRNTVYIFILFFLITQPETVILGVKNSLLLCYQNVIPSLFIFMVFANYISQESSSEMFSFFLRPYSRIMKVRDNKYPTYLFLSAIGGFAVGGNLLYKMQTEGYDKNFVSIASITMIGNSMAFCIYSVGIGMLNNLHVGIMIYISILLAQLLTAFIFSFFVDYGVQSAENINSAKPDFILSINQSVNTILIICGYVVVFKCICEGISLYINNKYISTIITALIEVTNGCIKVVSTFRGNHYLVCAALIILPISTLLQIYNFTDNHSIIKTLIVSRILVLPIGLFILSIFENLFPAYCQTMMVESFNIRTGQVGADISFVLFMISFSFISVCEKNKLFTKSQI